MTFNHLLVNNLIQMIVAAVKTDDRVIDARKISPLLLNAAAVRTDVKTSDGDKWIRRRAKKNTPQLKWNL